MKSETILIPVLIHVRPAAIVANAARKYVSDVSLKYRDVIVDGKNPVAILSLRIQEGSYIQLMVSGADEDLAISELTSLIEQLK